MIVGSEMENAPVVRLAQDALPAPIIDAAGGGITYYGISKYRGANTGDPVWKIYAVIVNGTITTTQYPNSDDSYSFVWDNRSTYTYAR